ncbi:MAG: hypothetical protein M3Q95_12890 [Bacteroidota bacterium]|nr:hypothetical protein [Bacteroidota bacterium]
MKKIFLVVSAFMIAATSLNAQNTTETFAKKDNVLGFGFGIGGVYGITSVSSQSPVFGVQYDRGIIELGFGGVIGVGGFMGYKSIVDKYDDFTGTYKDKFSILIFGARGTFHYDLFRVKNLDTYAGSMIAFHSVSHKRDYPNNYPNYNGPGRKTPGSAAYPSIFAGAKYYFAPQVAAYAEVGYGVSWLTMGIAFKF